MSRVLSLFLFCSTILLAACTIRIAQPNPASVHCTAQGGKLQMVEGADGTLGICTFTDGSLCDEWAFFDGKCAPGQNQPQAAQPTVQPADPQPSTGLPNPASVNCLDKGGHSYLVQARDGSEYGLCQLPSGKLCEEFAFLREECKP